MKEKRICPSCGLATFGDENFCSNCGEKLIIENKSEEKNSDTDLNNVSNMILCKNCGFENNKSFNFCGKCGASLKASSFIKKKSQPKPEAKSSEISQEKLSSRLIYIIVGLFVVIIIIIFIVNQQSKIKVSPVTQQQTSQQIQEVPQIDIQRLNQLKSIVENNPDDRKSILELANLYHDSHNLDEAITYYKKYLTLDEKNPDARVDMAICYFEKHDNENAIKEIQKAVSFNPKHQKAHFNLGIIYLSSGKIKEAMLYFKKSYEIDSTSEVGRNSKELLEEHKASIK
jgi:tetratricopeptide (TPR) repeat protein